MIPTQYNKVKEFHNVFGHPVASIEQPDQFVENTKLTLFRISLIVEEINELMEAYRNNDLVEFVDALADILYVVYGAGLVFGVHFEDAFDVARVSTNTDKNILQTKSDIITPLLNELKTTKDTLITTNDARLTLQIFEKMCCFIIRQVFVLAECIQVNINDCFTAVHKSNMSKVCTTEEDAQETVLWYKENEKRYTEPSYRLSGEYYIIFDKATSKILKSRKYEEAQPALSKILFA